MLTATICIDHRRIKQEPVVHPVKPNSVVNQGLRQTGPIMSMPTKMAMYTVKRILADGSKDRKTAGVVVINLRRARDRTPASSGNSKHSSALSSLPAKISKVRLINSVPPASNDLPVNSS
jgi:hypothetical protein